MLHVIKEIVCLSCYGLEHPGICKAGGFQGRMDALLAEGLQQGQGEIRPQQSLPAGQGDAPAAFLIEGLVLQAGFQHLL